MKVSDIVKLIVLLLFNIQCAYSQNQVVIVKTRGVMADNGTIVSGHMLHESIVTTHDNSKYESNDNGVALIPVYDNGFMLKSVVKEGYQLTDDDILHHRHNYSSKNPFYITMETYGQRLASKLAVERKIRPILMQQLMQQERAIEQMRNQQDVIEENYKLKLEELYRSQQSCELLIQGLAEDYSMIDFDQLDEFNKRLYRLIIDGNLSAADSLVNAKGDIHAEFEELERLNEIGKSEREKLRRSQEFAEKKINDIAERCFYKHRIHSMRIQHDSAVYYLGLRASLDSMNFRWQMDVGDYLHSYTPDYLKSISYYERARDILREQYGDKHESLIEVYNSLGMVYHDSGNYEASLNALQTALSLQKELFAANNVSAAATHYNLGNVYANMGLYEDAKDEHFNALIVFEENLGGDSFEVADVYNSIGVIYQKQEKYALALDNLYKAIDIYEGKNDGHSHDIAVFYNNIASVLFDMADYDRSLEYYNKALDVYKKLYDDNYPEFAVIYFNIGKIHNKLGDYDTALKYCHDAIAIMQGEADSYHPYLSIVYNGIGEIYLTSKDFDRALEYFYKALDIDNLSSTNGVNKAHTVNNIANVYHVRKMNSYALKYYLEALDINKMYLGEYNPACGRSYTSIGHVYSQMEQYDSALECYAKAEAIFVKSVGKDSPILSKVHCYQGDIHRKRNQREKALEHYFAALAVSLGSSSVDHAQAANVNVLIGMLHFEQNEIPQAISYLTTALRHLENCGDEGRSAKISALGYLGRSHYAINEYAESLVYYTEAVSLSDGIAQLDSVFLCNLYSNAGLVCEKLNDHQSAEEYYQRAINLIETESIDDKKLISTIYHNMAEVMVANKDYQGAVKNFEASLLIEYEIGDGVDELGLATIHRNLGYTYVFINEFDKAVHHIEKCKAIRESELDAFDRQVIDIYEQFGRIYTKKGEYERALEYYDVAHQKYMLSMQEQSIGAGMLYSSIGHLYYLMGSRSKAVKQLKKSKEILLMHYPEDHSLIQTLNQNISNLK